MLSNNEKIARGMRRHWQSRRAAASAAGELIGRDRVLAATTPDKSSAVIAKELGVSPSYVRECWRRANLAKRDSTTMPRIWNWGGGTE